MVSKSLICFVTMTILITGWGTPSFSTQGQEPELPEDVAQAMILNESENNNTRGRANAIPPNTRFVRASIDPVGDIDYFSFTVDDDDYVFVSIDTSSSTTSRDSNLRLMLGNRVIASDDDHGPNPQASGLAAVQLTRAGTYHLEVREGRNAQTITEYRLFLCVLPGPVRAEAEPNDAFDAANVASNVNRGIIGTLGDKDIWQFPASMMDTLSIGLNQTGQSVGFDATLELRDPAGMLIATQNNNGDRPDDAEFLNLLSLPASGMYTVRVVPMRMDLAGDRYDYLLGICLNGRPLRRRPIADPGADQGVLEGATVVLDGSASRGMDGENLEFKWTQVQGRNVVLSSEGLAMTSFVAPMVPIAELQFLVFELKVTTPFDLSSTKRVTVRVSDRFFLRDDRSAHRVLLNLAVPEFTWFTPMGTSTTRPMSILVLDSKLIDLVGAEGAKFTAGVSLDSREGKANFETGNMFFQIYDSNIDNSQE